MIQHQPWNQTRKKIDLETKYGDPSTVGYGYQSLLVALCTLVIYGHLIACIYNSKEAEVSNKKYVPRRQLFSCRYLGTIPCSAHAFVSSILNEMPSYHSLLLICPETMDPESVSHLPNNCLICKLRGEISSLGLSYLVFGSLIWRWDIDLLSKALFFVVFYCIMKTIIIPYF